jgi:hypothetical protein
MTPSVLLFLTIRALHVVLAAAWFGAALFITLYLVPAVEDAGPAAGGQLMNFLVRRGVAKYMASIGGLTILIGFYLFWRLTGDPAFPSSHRGMAISAGALTGIIALILGGSIIGASAKKLSALSVKMDSLPQGERAAAIKTMADLRSRMALFSKIVSALLFFSMVTMALAHLI